MVQDDDTGRHSHNRLDYPDEDDPEPTAGRPSRVVEDQIISLAGNSGWNPERIHAVVRRTSPQVTLATIRSVIAKARASHRL